MHYSLLFSPSRHFETFVIKRLGRVFVTSCDMADFLWTSFEDVNTIVGFSENVGGRFRFILKLWLTWACNLRVYNGEEKSGLLLRRGCWKFSLWYVCSLLIRFLARLLHFEWIYFALFYISTCFEGAFLSVSAIIYWNYVFLLWQNHLYL